MSVELQRTTTMLQLQTGAVQTFESKLNSGVSSALEGWIYGGQRFGLAMEQMFAHVLASEASFITEWLLKKGEMWVMDTALTALWSRISSTIAKTNNAAVAASGAAAATASIPIVGPALAIPAGAAMAAAVMAFEEGGIMPRTGFVLAHEGEGVLPRNLTSMLTSAAGEGKGGGVTHHHHYSINAVDGASVQRMLENNSHLFAAAAHNHLRRTR